MNIQSPGQSPHTAEASEIMVQLRSVSKAYGSSGNRVAALTSVTVGFPSGSFTAVMGASGSGKSTLLHCAAGLDRVDTGEVTIAGAVLGGMKENTLTRLRRTQIGFIFQSFNLVPSLRRPAAARRHSPRSGDTAESAVRRRADRGAGLPQLP